MHQWFKRLGRHQGRSQQQSRQQWLYMFLGPGLAAAGLGVLLTLLGTWSPLQRSVYNRLFHTREHLHPLVWDDRIVVIAIDDDSLDTYGRYPWSRDLYTELLYRLATVQPAAVGFDILMAESTPEDTELAEAIIDSGNVVLAIGGDSQGNFIGVTESIDKLAYDFFSVGHVKHITDPDGISRRAFLFERQGDRVADSFSIALLRTYQATITSIINPDFVAPELIPETEIQQLERFDQKQPAWVNWPGPIQSPQAGKEGVTTFSFQEVMTDDDVLDQLENKIVIVGYTATGVVGTIEDPLKTPFSQQIPLSGVYLHAALLDNLLNGRFLRVAPEIWTLALVILSGFGSSLVLKPMRLRGRLLFLSMLIPTWFMLGYGCFVTFSIVIPMAAPIGSTLLGMLFFQVAEQRERQALTDLFAISLSPQMADFVWQHKEELLTQGHIHSQELTATLLFTDIRGFTSISETLPSDQLLAWLNRYFEVMTECIMDHGGVVDKYIGDAIMAAFGVPLSRSGGEAVPQDALAAVKASVAMVNKLADLNKEFESQGLPTVRFGVGIHTGPVVAGTVGSRNRANYSLFGDTVNIAARLQDMTKTLTKNSSYPILMSETTYEHVVEHCTIITEKAKIQLRGRTAQTTVYALDEMDTAVLVS